MSKIKLILALFVIGQYSFAQHIVFTDSILKKDLIKKELKIDLNNNGEIEFVEAELVTSLNLSRKGINNISEINYFKNLEKLEFYYNDIDSLIIRDLQKLKEINCGTNNMQFLKLVNLSSLKVLEAGNNKLISAEIINCPNIQRINLCVNLLTSIDLTKFILLEDLWICDNQLSAIDISHNSKLSQLYLDNNRLTELDIRKNLKLENIYVDDNVKRIVNANQKRNSPFLMKPPPEMALPPVGN